MRKLTWLIALAVPTAFIACQKESVQKQAADVTIEHSSTTSTGNGAPSGTHYNLNIIGVPKGKSADMTGDNGGRIFVSLEGKTKINLTPAPEGESFQVLDANGTDGTASFQLPKDVTANWTAWARVPGNQTGSATITTCADYAWDGTPIDISLCTSVTMDRLNYGKFTNVSDNLLYVTLTQDIVNSNGEVVVKAGKYPLFDEALQNYFWQYDNNGLKILQLRFYPNAN
jgi:hypothetical protein